MEDEIKEGGGGRLGWLFNVCIVIQLLSLTICCNSSSLIELSGELTDKCWWDNEEGSDWGDLLLIEMWEVSSGINEGWIVVWETWVVLTQGAEGRSLSENDCDELIIVEIAP